MLMFRPLLRYADFKGRASRTEFFLFLGFQVMALGLCVGLALSSLSGIDKDAGEALGGLLAALGAAGLLMMVFALPNSAVLSRRLHDSNRSALWMSLLLPDVLAQMVLILSAGQVIRLAAAGLDTQAMIDAVMSAAGSSLLVSTLAILCRLALFIMTLMPGTRGPNRFGPDPRDPQGVTTLATGHASSQDLGGYSEERLDALIAQAKREQAMAALASDQPGTNGPSGPRVWSEGGSFAQKGSVQVFGRRKD
jgi:uncharacterized membrane protein YhaH (DUF805 family)